MATSLPLRLHHTDLQPLATRPATRVDPTRRMSIQGQGASPTKPTATMPSPSIVAARAYYLDSASPIGPHGNAIKRRRSLIQVHQFPRRHSILPNYGKLASQLENFTFTPTRKELQTVTEGEEKERKVKTEDDDVCMSELSKTTPDIQQARKSSLLCETPRDVLRQVPFQYTHDHLRDWGYAYLGNSGTADAFTNAVSLRQPSLAVTREEFQIRPAELVTIRARVLPKGNERKPFLLQRQFNIEELRSSIPRSRISQISEDITPTPLRRSSRIRRSSAWKAGEHQKKAPLYCRTPTAGRLTPLGTGAVPIHIEYALHYLPVLAALMLSGHVRKGDIIDLPIPHPESWKETVTYIYTGAQSPSPGVRENISYLAGHDD
ncbi:hypothetical protein L207DRAFT_530830 [Hyaloscypha variabilis F]|uniref:Uncharacterized protein n=1 Tax=Hyaloscypha variabilis (strain UAMH 11265 / GT02V1 / F) TaxID=1149755 RepID=A0A2J6RH81_HYAVF|nr:hypothetical protein L207DRAFT_530830 [Hyaloscypha variabilis F]